MISAASPARLVRMLLALPALVVAGRTAEPDALDLAIVNARIVDGAGNPWFRGSVGLRGGRIVEVRPGAPLAAPRVIDAADRVVAPGFIDLMGQSTLIYIQDRGAAESRLRQGITTHHHGEGGSHAPLNRRLQPRDLAIDGRNFRWSTYAEYFKILEDFGLPLNVVHNVGAAQVRQLVIGDVNRPPTAAELAEMERHVDQAMRDGAVGLSTSLIYPPGIYASTDELVALARVAARHGGVYFSHIRNESGGLLAAIDEALHIGRAGGLPVHIYHLKAAGRAHWPLVPRAIEKIDAARRAGLDVTADVYPYIRNGLNLGAFLPPWHYDAGRAKFLTALADPALRRRVRAEVEAPESNWENWFHHVGRDWDKVLITGAGDFPEKRIAGLSVAQAAKLLNRDVWDFAFDLIQYERTRGASVAPESMDEGQKHQILRAPWTMIDTDTSPANPAHTASTHPRAFGAFPRVLAKYVREDRVLSLEEAVRRMTSLAANRLGLPDRGRIAPGQAADLVIFDPEKIQDRATFASPLLFAEGVDHLLVNGTPVIEDRRLTGARPGRTLRRATR